MSKILKPVVPVQQTSQFAEYDRMASQYDGMSERRLETMRQGGENLLQNPYPYKGSFSERRQYAAAFFEQSIAAKSLNERFGTEYPVADIGEGGLKDISYEAPKPKGPSKVHKGLSNIQPQQDASPHVNMNPVMQDGMTQPITEQNHRAIPTWMERIAESESSQEFEDDEMSFMK